MTSATLPSSTGIVTSYTYDDGDRLTGISHVKDGTTTVASVAYTLDDVGNRTQRVDQQGTHTYAYDDLYRLTSVTYPGPSTTSYAFDAFGNRTSMTNGSGTTGYTYDDADRITQVQPPNPASAISYDWDDNGNLTDRGADSFEWDYEDRMVEATVNSVTTTFAYRGDGLRDSRTVGMTTTTFTWDINAGLPVVLDDGNQYLYGAGLSAMKQSGSWFYYLADGLGSTMAIVDSSGNSQKSYQYDVYGEVTGGSGSLANEFDFAGQQTDGSTGLQYLRARYYDPATGVFLSREPLALDPGWLEHTHSFAIGNPTRFTDTSGLMIVDNEKNGGVSGGSSGGRVTNGSTGKIAGGPESVAKGRYGADSMTSALESAGYKVLGREVRVKTGLGDRVIDILVEYKNKVYAIEVKTGPYAKLRPEQYAKDQWINDFKPTVTINGEPRRIESSITIFQDTPRTYHLP